MDETDLDSYFYHIFLDISQFHHRIIRVSKGSNKNSFAFKVFHFCDSKLQQPFILKDEVSISEKDIESLLDSLVEFLKTFDRTNKVSQIPLHELSLRLGLQKQKKRTVQSLLQGYSWALEQTNFIVVPVRTEQDLCLFCQKVWTIRWSIHSYRSCQPGLPQNETSVQESIFCCLQLWHFWEQSHCLAHSSLIVGMTIALLVSLETFSVQLQSVWVNFAGTKRLLNRWTEAIITVHNARLWARCVTFLLKNKQIPFSCRLVKGCTFLKRVQCQFKMLLRKSHVLANIVSTERKENLLVVM